MGAETVVDKVRAIAGRVAAAAAIGRHDEWRPRRRELLHEARDGFGADARAIDRNHQQRVGSGRRRPVAEKCQHARLQRRQHAALGG